MRVQAGGGGQMMEGNSSNSNSRSGSRERESQRSTAAATGRRIPPPTPAGASTFAGAGAGGASTSPPPPYSLYSTSTNFHNYSPHLQHHHPYRQQYSPHQQQQFLQPQPYFPQQPQFIWYPPPSAAFATDAPLAFYSPMPSSGAKDVSVGDSISNPDDPPSNSASPSSHHSQLLNTNAETSPSATTETRTATPSVPAACLACRGKHLKCDGQTPCSRCQSSASECVYVASRRGYKGPRRGTAQNPNKRHASSSPKDSSVTSTSADDPMFLAATTAAATSGPVLSSVFSPSVVLPDTGPNSPFLTAGGDASSSNGVQIFRGLCTNGAPDMPCLAVTNPNPNPQNGVVTMPSQVAPSAAERCLDAFYHYFHAAHPFVLPKEAMLRLAKETSVEPLLAAMRWIGSLYIDAGPARASLYEEARRLAYEPNRPKCGFLVQALMVLVVGLDGNCQQDKAREVLSDAERMAVQIGLNTRAFATLHGRGLPVLEESWRRTWWDLYVIDGMIAGVHRSTNFLLFDVPCDVALPCEEYQYFSGNIPQPLYLEDLEDSEFSGDEREFSSFAYLILCARNLGRLMRIPPIFGPEDENIARIEALLTNWRLHLPASKRDALHKDGRLDEMMFQAHMLLHVTSILLHQPHSQLDSSATRDVTSCAPHHAVPSGDVFNSHTKHTIQSANEISKMVTHRVPLLSHTHFFTCVITLSSIVHLSKWALFFIPHDDDDLRQQIRLNIGALHKLSEVWNSADRACGQVKGVAQEIYRMKKQQQLTPQYWLGLTENEVLDSIAADDSIINDIETILPGMPSLMT